MESGILFEFVRRPLTLCVLSLVVLSVGFNSVKGALVTGTYHSSKGLSYGGKSLSKSATLLQEFFERPEVGIINAKKYVFVDVHTGLGPPGNCEFVVSDRTYCLL